MFFGPFMWIIFLGIAIVLVVMLMRWSGASGIGTQQLSPPSGKTALDILEERFARGEIDKEEFEERRRILEKEV